MALLPPLISLRTSEAAARHLNFSHAAEEFNVTPSAVSHQIKELKKRLGVSFFERLHRGLALTAAGEALLPGIRAGLASFSQAVDGLQSSFLQNALTVSVPPSVAMKWLVTRLAALKQNHPGVDVSLSSDIALPDFGREDVDIAIHNGYGDYHDLESERLGSNSVAPMCSPLLLSGARPLRSPSDLRHSHCCTIWGHRKRMTRHTTGTLGCVSMAWKGSTRLWGFAFVLNAAVAGAGVAIGKTALAVDDLRAGRLICLFDSVVPEKMAY